MDGSKVSSFKNALLLSLQIIMSPQKDRRSSVIRATFQEREEKSRFPRDTLKLPEKD